MATINFKRLEIFTDISGRECVAADVGEQLANLVYNNSFGITGHTLAHKIYDAPAEVDLTETEAGELKRIVGEFCRAPIIDAVNRCLCPASDELQAGETEVIQR